MAKIKLKLIMPLLSGVWGAAVASLVWRLLSIDQGDISIPISALAGAEGLQSWQYIIAIVLFAFCVWAIPTALLWLPAREYRNSSALLVATGLAGLMVFAIISLSLERTQPDDSTIQRGDIGRENIGALEAWRCNNSVEVSCLDGRCTVADGDSFTPMSISIEEDGEVSVCAYSGCWEGRAEIIPAEGFVILVGRALPFSRSPDPGMAEDILIAIDKADNIALLKVDTFAQPLICEKHENKSAINPGDR